MARHSTGRSVLSGVVLGGALLAGAVGIAGQANAALAPAPTSVQAGGPAPLSSMPTPPLHPWGPPPPPPPPPFWGPPPPPPPPFWGPPPPPRFWGPPPPPPHWGPPPPGHWR
ncbi:hypothetical protein [Mycolicibacterium houstonense]|uniref:hypothetical protein n=1 Tax=Mycolicibacterium houstonense TaxID=146021 RepID=UPI0021F25FB0|nr:hypothetical protein [Mycolicibacterium houstonense]